MIVGELAYVAIALLLALAMCLKLFALSANRDVDRYVDQELRALPVYTNVHIYKGALVGIEAGSGCARGLVAGDKFAGIAYEEVDNTGGDSAALMVRVFTIGDFEHTLSGADRANNGDAVYASDDATLTLTPGNSPVGWQVDVPGSDKILLRINAFPRVMDVDGLTAEAAELNMLADVTAGTVEASKAVTADANKDVSGLRNVTATGTVKAGGLTFETGATDVTLAVSTGNIIVSNLPVADPEVQGALWSNNGVLTLSEGGG